MGAAFGWIGLGAVRRTGRGRDILTLTLDYTQHYGVVRSHGTAPGRLARIRREYVWTLDHASNQSTFDLGLHVNHHLSPTLRHSHLVARFRVMNTRLRASPRAEA